MNAAMRWTGDAVSAAIAAGVANRGAAAGIVVARRYSRRREMT
jgi:hypothetical protein